MSDLAGLIERVREEKGPSREIDAMIAAAVARQPVRYVEDDDATYMVDGNNEYVAIERVTSSIDAALGLVERLLPGWRYAVVKQANSTDPAALDGFHCWLEDPEGSTDHQDGPRISAPLAILTTLLSALQDTTHAK